MKSKRRKKLKEDVADVNYEMQKQDRISGIFFLNNMDLHSKFNFYLLEI